YYVIRVSDHLLALARTRQDASAGRAIDLTPGASGSQHALITDTFVSTIDASRTAPVVDYVANTIELKGHGLTTGQQVSYDPGDNDPIRAVLANGSIGSLTKGPYAVMVVDADHIRLAHLATPNTPIDLLPGLSDSGLQEF